MKKIKIKRLINAQAQVDFEFTEFEGDTPMEFSRFGHSSSLFDAQAGFKGVCHKYLLRALAGGASLRKDVLILTKTGSYEKPKFKATKGEKITELRMQKFFVSKGLRKAYEAQYTPDGKLWVEDGKQVYKETNPKDSKYETSITEMFKVLFDEEDSKDLKKMWSFVGIVDLMKKHLDAKSIDNTFMRFADLCWGFSGQKLERDHKEIDMEIKANAINYMIKHLPGVKKHEEELQKMSDRFYAGYDKVKLTESNGAFRSLLENLKDS